MNNFSSAKNNRGFVTTIILIIVGLIALKYAFHFDLVQYLKSPGPQKVAQSIATTLKDLYNWVVDLFK